MCSVHLSRFALISFLSCLLSTGMAQEGHKSISEEHKKDHPHGMKGNHRFTFELSHTHISQGKDASGDRKWLALPSLGFKYDFWVSNKTAFGLHTDLITETFVVEEHLGEGKDLERSTPIAVLAVGLYKPTKHSTFLLGMGGEFAKEKNLVINRFGYEWSAHVLQHWEVGGSLAYDLRWKAYDSWTVGIGISHLIGGNQEHRRIQH